MSAAWLNCGPIRRRRARILRSRGSLARNLRTQVGQFLALALQLTPQNLFLLLKLYQALARRFSRLCELRCLRFQAPNAGANLI